MEPIRTAFDAWKADSSRRSLIALLEASQHPVYGTCFEVLRHRHDAEDAAQRSLVEIQDGLDRITDADHFLKRLRLVAFHTALDARRARRRRVERERKASDMNPTAPVPDEVREAIHEAMAALDEESRALVIEHYFDKATLEEMGRRRGLSGAAIWKRIESLKGRLREALALAGLGAAAAQAEACLESVAVTSAPANLVTGSVLAKAAAIGGGLMAAKTSTAVVATLVATFTFAIGLGGGLSIQAAREPAPSLKPPVARHVPAAVDSGKATQVAPATRPAAAGVADPATGAESREDRLKLALEIWTQFKRPRFWKDKDAQDETLPKLKLLGPDLAAFFIERFREPGLKHEQMKEAARLAAACGGPEAATFILELANAGANIESVQIRQWVRVGLLGDPGPSIPLSGELRSAAMVLSGANHGQDRFLGLCLLTYADPQEWMPILTQAACHEREHIIRMKIVELIAMKGGAEALFFLKNQKEEIVTLPADLRQNAEVADRQRKGLFYTVDKAIERLELQLKR